MSQARSSTAARLLALALAAAAFATISACQTVKGAGEDIQNVGEAGERAIDGD